MKIELKEITIGNIAEHYKDLGDDGVFGYNDKLNIRPPYQREYIYDDKKRDEVVRTIKKGFPLNVMYWCLNDDDTYEVLDGQQRIISFCQYVDGVFSVDNKFFQNLTKPEQDRILNYKCMIYICEGETYEKLDWFKIINIGGVVLTPQELRNAIYTGTWLSDAKLFFSKRNCPAKQQSDDYVKADPIRQELLEKALKWIVERDNLTNIEEYMGRHQHDPNANELKQYFRNIMWWIEDTFPVKRSEMKAVEWNTLYDKFKDKTLDATALEEKIKELMQDEDVTKKSGIYEFVLTGNENKLNIRAFDDRMKREAYERQNGICPVCGEHFEINEMQGDHITPWSKGGKTTADNCQMLCSECNRRKSNV